MDNIRHLSFNVLDRSYFSLYKKDIHKIAVDHNFPAKKVAEIDIIVAEIMSNLVKHTKGGELLVRVVNEGTGKALEMICIDGGSGMADTAKMIGDGVSTAGTLGNGLGAIKRLSDVFQIYSIPDWGTVLLSRVYDTDQPLFRKAQKVEIRSIVVPKPGETECGDTYSVKSTPDNWMVYVGDGLGHGPEASLAANEGAKAFRMCLDTEPVEIIRYMHAAVKKTRGLVGTIAIYNFKERKWSICGVGNIATNLAQRQAVKNIMSYNGIIGMNIPNSMKSQEVMQDHNQTIIMCSDGIRTRWDIQKYPMIMKYDLSVLAAAIYKDFARKTDDMTVVVGRIN